jgi:hypothetical protein
VLSAVRGQSVSEICEGDTEHTIFTNSLVPRRLDFGLVSGLVRSTRPILFGVCCTVVRCVLRKRSSIRGSHNSVRLRMSELEDMRCALTMKPNPNLESLRCEPRMGSSDHGECRLRAREPWCVVVEA